MDVCMKNGEIEKYASICIYTSFSLVMSDSETLGFTYSLPVIVVQLHFMANYISYCIWRCNRTKKNEFIENGPSQLFGAYTIVLYSECSVHLIRRKIERVRIKLTKILFVFIYDQQREWFGIYFTWDLMRCNPYSLTMMSFILICRQPSIWIICIYNSNRNKNQN